MIDAVDPFIGTDVTALPPPSDLAATWWWPKPQVGNTHPGAVAPFGMVSACAYSGAYPTGYGVHDLSTEGVPTALYDRLAASGFTHFQQSGTGAIRKYYNYFRVSPMVDPLDDLDTLWIAPTASCDQDERDQGDGVCALAQHRRSSSGVIRVGRM